LDLTREEDLTAGAEGGGHSGTTPGPAEAHAEGSSCNRHRAVLEQKSLLVLGSAGFFGLIVSAMLPPIISEKDDARPDVDFAVPPFRPVVSLDDKGGRGVVQGGRGNMILSEFALCST
jgi:hypothetical protein